MIQTISKHHQVFPKSTTFYYSPL